MAKQLLQLKGVTLELELGENSFKVLSDINFELAAGETVAVVGESGCGKSLTALSIMGLVPNPPGRVVAGQILYQGEDLLAKSEKGMQAVRGKEIAMIFQEPMTSLNPLLRIGEQLIEGMRLHRGLDRAAAKKEAIEIMRLVGISSPASRMREYPHQFSGGMRQRVMIAIALACDPRVLIADEPTTALDVTIQAQILHLMQDLQKRLGTSILLITHDLGVVAKMADRVLVMYLGQIVEMASVRSLFKNPLHPYTAGLLRSVPNLNDRSVRLQQIEGMVPSPQEQIAGCKFHGRCPRVTDRCRTEAPQLQNLTDGRQVACWYPAVVREVSQDYERAATNS